VTPRAHATDVIERTPGGEVDDHQQVADAVTVIVPTVGTDPAIASVCAGLREEANGRPGGRGPGSS
jgi:hypothetical protein